eukprot:Platyproteum_vivax@DN6940_c0_g1_i2.p1
MQRGDYSCESQLDKSMFYWSSTKGVQKDIAAAWNDSDLHVFSVASQHNCAEAPSISTPDMGAAMKTSNGDLTQGPLAQRNNPVLFEFVTDFLTHLGYNTLEYALPSAGKTYTTSYIQHGYLRQMIQLMHLLMKWKGSLGILSCLVMKAVVYMENLMSTYH